MPLFQRFPTVALLFGALLMPLTAAAADAPKAADAKIQEQIRSSLKVLLPGKVADEIRATRVPGLYEVTFGSQLVYMTEDGRFLVQGTIIDLERRENLTDDRVEEIKAKSRTAGMAELAKLGEENMIIFGPKDAKHTITVFTDIDCGWCRRLHAEIGDYAKAGIRVRYLMYPRAGKDSDSYRKAVSVWCSKDRNAALTKAKAGEDPGTKTCDNPIDKHMAIANMMGVEGTPAMFYKATQIGGYHPAARVKAALDALIARQAAAAKK